MSIIMLLAGVIIGWMCPQPLWAKPITDYIAGFFKKS